MLRSHRRYALQSVYLDIPVNKRTVTRNDDEISASPRNIGIRYSLNIIVINLKMAAIGRNM